MTNDFICPNMTPFTDKDCIHVPTSHRFYELAIQLAQYQGADILLLSDDDTSMISSMREQILRHQEGLLKRYNTPQACVLVVITDEPNPRLLLTRRSNQLNSHAGEVSFVGGRRDDTDASSAEVALREAYEEVGLYQNQVQLLGYLPMQISKKGLLVRPVVACVEPEVVDKLIPNADEIARLFWLPFYVLKNPPVNHIFDRVSLDEPNKPQQALHTPAWVYDCDNDGTPEVVWGLTGRILASLMEIGFGIKHEWYYRMS